MVGRGVGVGEAEDGERAHGRRLDEVDGRLEQGHAGALGADEGLREVEPVLGQELVDVVAADPAGEVGGVGAHDVGGAVAQVAQVAVDPALGAGAARGGVQGGVVHRAADVHAGPVGEQDVEGADVVDGLAPRHRVRAARVVADHPAEGAAIVRRRVRTEREAVRAGGVAQVVEHRAGLDAGGAGVRVDLQHAVHVAVEVDDDGLVGRLPADARPGAQGQQRHAVAARDLHRALDVVGVDGLHDAERDVAVVRRVRRPHRAGGGVEPDRAAHRPGELLGQQGGRGARAGRRARHDSILLGDQGTCSVVSVRVLATTRPPLITSRRGARSSSAVW